MAYFGTIFVKYVLENEKAELLPADDLWGSERVTVSYGQGMASTSAQLVAAIAFA